MYKLIIIYKINYFVCREEIVFSGHEKLSYNISGNISTKLHCCRIIGGGETLPRLKGSNNMKPKPVAKIIANTRSSIPVNSEEIERDWEEVWSQ